MVATTGAQLLPQEAVQNFIHHLLPKATILTPNLPEARLFLQESGHGNKPPSNVDDLVDMTKSLQALGPQYVLLKGGHLPMSDGRVVSSVEADKNLIVDVLVGNEVTEVLETPYIDSNNTHGTGCSLACQSVQFNFWQGLVANLLQPQSLRISRMARQYYRLSRLQETMLRLA